MQFVFAFVHSPRGPPWRVAKKRRAARCFATWIRPASVVASWYPMLTTCRPVVDARKCDKTNEMAMEADGGALPSARSALFRDLNEIAPKLFRLVDDTAKRRKLSANLELSLGPDESESGPSASTDTDFARAHPVPATSSSQTKIFVGGLAPTVGESDLKQTFSRFGEVSTAFVITKKNSQKSRGFGFVVFRKEESADAALNATETICLHGRVLHCEVAAPRGNDSRFVVQDVGASTEAVRAIFAERAALHKQWSDNLRKRNPWYDFDKKWAVDEKVSSFICGRPYRPFEVPRPDAAKQAAQRRLASLQRQTSTEREMGVADLSDLGEDSSSDGEDATSKQHEAPAAKVPGKGTLNERLADYFLNVSSLFANRHKTTHGKSGKVTNDNFRASYYKSLALALRRTPQPVDRAEKIRHVSNGHYASHPKLRRRLREILILLNDQDGKVHSKRLPEEDAQARAMKDLMKAWGIGPSVANSLIRRGVHSLADLQERAGAMDSTTDLASSSRASGSLASGLRLGRKFHRGAMAALPFTAEINQRIPRAEVTAIGDVVRAAAVDIFKRRGHDQRAVLKRLVVQICGSYRRGNQSSGDVDILMTDKRGGPSDHCFLGELVSNLEASGFLIAHLVAIPTDYMNESSSSSTRTPENHSDAEGSMTTNTKIDVTGAQQVSKRKQSYMGICRLGPHGTARRIDLKTYPAHQFPFASLYFTGSAHFNRSMRLFAKKKLIKLNDDCLVERTGQHRCISCACEGEIFTALGLPYRAPSERNCPSDK